jgi:pyruvate/2-oxoglutarate dehydrogenase complex dihydrolipoamide dehydrogenase (E3) component
LTESEAGRQHGRDVAVTRFALADSDRAQAERDAGGLVKVVARRNGRILGASILAPQAGEPAHLWVLAIEQRLKLKDIAGMLAPYPTWGEANKLAAAEFYKPLLFGRWTRRAVRALSWLP